MDDDKHLKRVNPISKANIFSLFTFGYSIDLLKRGYTRDLEEVDLYDLSKGCLSSNCGKQSESDWKECKSSFTKFFLRRYGLQYLFFLTAILIWTEAHSILQPYASSRLISYFAQNQTEISKSEALSCGGLVIFLGCFRRFFWKNIHVYEIFVTINMFTSVKSLLYRKALRTSKNSSTGINVGNMLTLITKDMQCIESNPWVYIDLTVLFVQTGTGLYLLWMKIGNAAYLGIGLLSIALPLQTYLSWLVMKTRLTVAKKSDERNQIIQEVLSSIKIVKMYVWESFFIEKISKTRKEEIASLINVFFTKLIVVAIGVLSSKLTFQALILFYIYLGNTPDTETLFYILTIFQQFSNGLSINIPSNLSTAAQIQASLKRINSVLQADGELPKERHDQLIQGTPHISVENVTVSIQEVTILNNICLNLTEPGLFIVTGAVGSGKSSLLIMLLKDYISTKGKIVIKGTTSYASQEPWLFPGTIKYNILFGETYNSERYNATVKSCALDYDLSCLNNGDLTLVADRGQNLSKGQQARVNLARAVYRQSDFYLLDDTLTSLDEHVQDYIFNEAIVKMLRRKIVIMVSQNPKHIEKADTVIVMENGSITSVRTQKCSSKELNVKFRKIISQDIRSTNDVKTFQNHNESANINRKAYDEHKKQGKVDLEVYKKYFQFGGGFVIFSLIIILHTVVQYFDSYSDRLLTRWIDLQHQTLILSQEASSDNTTYQQTFEDKEYAFDMYIIMTLLQAVFGLIKFCVFLVFCRKASINIHKAMLEKIVRAIMMFFDYNYVGNILNRFSYDMNNIDENLPFIFPEFVGILFNCIGSLVLVASVSGLLMLPLSVIVGLLILMRVVVISSLRSLKRLEASTRSPLVGHINTTLEGLTTIRAFRAEELVIKEFDKHQDNYNRAVFTSQIISTALEFFMSMIDCFSTVIVVARVLFFEHDMSVGDVGLIVGQVTLVTELILCLVKYWADLESNMTSVERSLEYIVTDQEKISGKCDSNWPQGKEISFKNINLCYGIANVPVLKQVNFSVAEREKIGIVGRTGAGKSSIISVVYRLYNFEGSIYIDGVDTKSLSLSYLRKNIAIIPQDPVLFTGTVRDNIDPYNEYTDSKIWEALTKVRMKDALPNLDALVKQNGVGFSVGEKQLICLARAALKNNKIVVLDEATANMDRETETLLYSVVEEVFVKCTILIIAHRLDYIKKCDRVMVIDSGKVIEFDDPQKLLRNSKSKFFKMCTQNEENPEGIS